MWSEQIDNWRDYDSNYYISTTVTLSQTGSTSEGAVLEISRYMYLYAARLADETLELICNDTTVSKTIAGFDNRGGDYAEKTTTATITIPSDWVGKTIAWRLKTYNRSGTFVFDGYGQFILSLTAENSTVGINRQSSPKAEAATGALANGAAIYTDDALIISAAVPTGYKLSALTLNGADIESGANVTVSGNAVVVGRGAPMATADVYTNGAWGKHLIYIYPGGAWGLYQAEIYSDGAWSKYF